MNLDVGHHDARSRLGERVVIRRRRSDRSHVEQLVRRPEQLESNAAGEQNVAQRKVKRCTLRSEQVSGHEPLVIAAMLPEQRLILGESGVLARIARSIAARARFRAFWILIPLPRAFTNAWL